MVELIRKGAWNFRDEVRTHCGDWRNWQQSCHLLHKILQWSLYFPKSFGILSMKLRLDVMVYKSLGLVDYLWFREGEQTKDRTIFFKTK